MASFPTVHSKGWHLPPSFVVSSWALWSFEFIHKLRILYMWFVEDLRFLWLLLRSFSCPSVVESKLEMQSRNQRGEKCASDLLILMKSIFWAGFMVPGSSLISLNACPCLLNPCSAAMLLCFLTLNSAGYEGVLSCSASLQPSKVTTKIESTKEA